MEEGPLLFFSALSVLALLGIASRFLRRHEKGENVDAHLNAVGDELSRRGVGRNVDVEPH